MKRFGLPAAALAGLALVAPGLHADELRMPDTAAKVHVVETGDTLWDIAQAYLQDPFQWPKIWRDNDQVANPDLIYPGGRIRIPVELLKPEVREAMAPAEPEVVEVPVPKGTLNPLMVEAAGFITRDLDPVGRVIGTFEDRTLMGEGDTVFVKLDWGQSKEAGTQYTVVRPLHKVRHPSSYRSVGQLVHVVGVITLTGQDQGPVEAHVDRTYDAILAGDRLVPYVQPDVTVTEQAPDVQGTVVATRDDRAISASGDVVFLDRGARDGLAPGMVLEVMGEGDRIPSGALWGKVQLPQRELATLRVLSVRERNATARVENASEAVGVGNPFRTPLPAAPEPAEATAPGDA